MIMAKSKKIVTAPAEEIINENAVVETVEEVIAEAPVKEKKTKKASGIDWSTKGWWFFGFVLPIVAYIMYFKNKLSEDTKYPTMARGAFICTVTLVVVIIIGAFTTAFFFAISYLMLNNAMYK